MFFFNIWIFGDSISLPFYLKNIRLHFGEPVGSQSHVYIWIVIWHTSLLLLYVYQLSDAWFHTVPGQQFILSRVFIFRMQHGSRCSRRIRSVSSALIREDHFYATWRRTCLGSLVSCWCRQFSDAAGSGFKGQPVSPSAWLAQIKSASRRSPAAARYQWKLLELPSHRATARQERQAAPVNYSVCRPEPKGASTTAGLLLTQHLQTGI